MSVASVYLPTVGQTFKLGAILPAAPKQVLRFRRFFSGAPAVPPPASLDYSGKAGTSLNRVYLNNELGCCVFSGKFHHIGVWSANDSDSGGEVQASDAEVRSQYFAYTGGRDNGAIITDVLDIMKSRGLTAAGRTYKIDGYVGVDNSDKLETQVALNLFGGLTLGLDLPGEWANAARPGAIWDLTNSRSVGGHDVMICGYSESGVTVSTWGMLVTMTWRAFLSRAYVRECYAMLAPLWYGNDKLAPSGVDAAGLKSALDMLGGGQVPPLPEPPAPVPVPPPTPVPPVPVPPSGIWAKIAEFLRWLADLLKPNSPQASYVAASCGIEASALPDWVGRIIAALPKLLPVIITGIQRGDSWTTILMDCILALRNQQHLYAAGPFGGFFKDLVLKLIQNFPELAAIVAADLAAGKPWPLILLDIIAALKDKPAL